MSLGARYSVQLLSIDDTATGAHFGFEDRLKRLEVRTPDEDCKNIPTL